MSGLTDFLKNYAPGLERQGEPAPAQKPGIDVFLQDYQPQFPEEPPAPRTPGSPLISREQQEENDATLNLIQARGMSPDVAAKASIASQQTGIPLEVAQRNLAEAEEEAMRARDRVLLRAARGTAKFYQDQQNAAIAHDKVEHLSAWEGQLIDFGQGDSGGGPSWLNRTLGQAAYAYGTGLATGWRDTTISPLVLKEMNGQTLTPGERVVLEEWRADREKPTGLDEWSVNAGIHNFGSFVSGLTAQMLRASAVGMATAMAGAGVAGLALTPAAAPAGFAVGGVAGVAAGMFEEGRKQSTAMTYERLRQVEDENGAKIDPDLVRWISNGVGAIGGALNMIGFGQVTKPVGSLAETVSRMLIEEAAAKPSVRQALTAIGGGTAKGFGAGLALGAANEASMVMGETLAAEIDNLARGTKFADVLNDSAEREKAARAIVESAVTMGLTLAGIHVAAGAPRLAAEAVRVHRASQDARFFDAIVQGTEASGLPERPTGRDAIQRWLGIQLDDGPHDTVYVPAAKLVELYQDATRIGAESDPLFAHLPDLGKQVAEALPVNGDVAIPAKDFFARLVGTPALEKLKGDVRLREDGYSANEAREMVKERDRLLKEARDRWEAEGTGFEPDPTTRVFEHWQSVLTEGAGYTKSAANHLAAVMAARYATRAARRPDLYSDAWEAFQRAGTGQGVEVRTEVPERVRAAPPDHLDLLLNSLRSGRDPKLPDHGPTLLEYISGRGGMLDQGGELRARDLGRWHLTEKGRPKPGVNPLIAEPGAVGQQSMFGRSTVEGRRLTLHDTAQAAWEDGYFPELTEAPTEKQFLEAIDEELRGRPRSTEQAPSDRATAFREDRELLDQTLGRLGIDLKTATNAEVRQALGEAIVRDDNRPTFDQGAAHVDLSPGGGGKEVKFGDTTIDYGVARDGKSAEIILVKTAAAKRGEGSARRALEEFLRATDAQGLTVFLTAEPMEEGITKGRLENLYRSLGFKPNAGRNRDFSSRAGMVREPTATYDQPALDTPAFKSVHNRGTFDPGSPNILYQPKRGSITFGDGRAIIQLFQSRDLSTLLHESGHLWLEELRFDARGQAPDSDLGKMWSTTLKWLGIDERTWDGEFTRDQHEKFARGFETYLMEGKAPSTALASAFRAFKNWLVQIYRKLSALDAPMTPEMRQVFDRLVATDDEIESVRQKQVLNPLFKDAAAAGMSEGQFRTYTERATAVVADAEQRVLEKAMAGIRAQRTREWKAEERRTRAVVRGEQMQDPGMQALHFLRVGKIYDGETPEALAGAKLDRADIVNEYGDDTILKMLPRGIYREENGYSAESLAGLFGFDSGRAMLDRLAHLEAQRAAMAEKGDKRSVLRAAVDEETARRMQERMGGHLDEQAIADEAMAAVHSDKVAALIGAELKALARRADRPGGISVDDVKAWAADHVSSMTAREVGRYQRFLQAERSAGVRAERALAKGDFVEAFKAKQDQLVNQRLYVEAKKAADQMDTARATLDRYAGARTIKNMDQEYLEQIHGLLEDYDFKRRSDAEISRVRNFELWAANQKAEGVDHLGDKLSERMRSQIGRLNYRDLTVDEVRGLTDTVEQIARLGRLKKELQVGQERRDFNETMEKGQAQLEALPLQVGFDVVRAKVDSWTARAKGQLRSLQASVVKIEQLIDWMDGGDPNGLFNKILFRRAAEAQVRENDMLADYAKRLVDAAESVPADVRASWRKRIDAKELVDKRGDQVVKTKNQLIAAALNLGNESNKGKLLDGYGWSEDVLKAVVDRHLTKADWDYIQKLWDTIESLWPAAAELERRVNGVEAPKIEPASVATPHGIYRGGYYPVAYDYTLSAEAASNMARRGEEGLFPEGNYVRATTSQGYQKGRTGFTAPVLLDLSIIPRHFAQVIHDITHREAVRDMARVISDRRFIEAFRGAFGPEAYDTLMPWLKNIARNLGTDNTAPAFWSNLAKSARINATMVGMGLRVATGLKQISGTAEVVEMIGAKWTLAGQAAFFGNPFAMGETHRFVTEKSGEMRSRFDTLDRDLKEGLRGLLGQDSIRSHVQRFAYYGIGVGDMMVTVPAWMGAYKKALHEGMGDGDAVQYADKVVRLSQGAGSAKDLSSAQFGRSEFWKLATMYYSWAAHFVTRQADLVRSFRQADSMGDYAMIAARSFWLMVAPVLLGQLIGGDVPSDDEDWGTWAARNIAFNIFAGVPIARDAASAANQYMGHGFGSYTATPAARGVEAIASVSKDVWNATVGSGEVSDKWLRHAIEAPGYVFGLPTGQPGATAQFMWDLRQGNQSAESLGEWYRGLLTGKARANER